jgi:hypothetical protein
MDMGRDAIKTGTPSNSEDTSNSRDKRYSRTESDSREVGKSKNAWNSWETGNGNTNVSKDIDISGVDSNSKISATARC